MDMLKEDLEREISRIKDKLEKSTSMNEEDIKVVLLSVLLEEDLHESK